MSTTSLDPAGPWTFASLADLPDDGRRYEVVDGHLVVTPPPIQEHQLISNRLQRQLLATCPPEWEVVVEMPLPLGDDGRVPDLSAVRHGGVLGSASQPYPNGPERFGLVIEVVSPDSRKTDRFAKPGEYAEAGIPLFWRVEREPELMLLVFELQDGMYVERASIRSRGLAKTPWGEVEIDLDALRTPPLTRPPRDPSVRR